MTPDGRVVKAADQQDFPVGVALNDNFPEGCMGIWDERPRDRLDRGQRRGLGFRAGCHRLHRLS